MANAPLRVVETAGLPPRVEPAPDVTQQTLAAVHETLKYLKAEPQARAKQEAEPLIAAERQAREQAAREYHAEVERLRAAVPVPPPPNDTEERLRGYLTEHEEAIAVLRAELEVKSALATHAAAQAAEAHTQLATLRAAPPRVEERVVYREREAPAAVELEQLRRPDGLLEAVLLRAEGRAPIRVEVVRGDDLRMRALKLRR